MKAIQIHQFGSPEVVKLEDIATPSLSETEIRLKVKAASLNPADLMVIAGEYQHQPSLPFTPGFEAAGEVIEVGNGVESFNRGDRIIAVLPYRTAEGVRFGAMAQELVVPASNVVKIPDKLDFVTATTMPVAYGTAYISLVHRGGLKAGETVLINGSTGNVGSAAIEIAKCLEATVIATAGGAPKVEAVKKKGADYAIDYRNENIRDRVLEITDGKGANLVLDPVGGAAFDAAIESVGWEGRILGIGAASGKIPEVSILTLLTRNISVVGADFAAYVLRDFSTVERSLERVFQWYAEGAIEPVAPSTIALSEVPATFAAIANEEKTEKLAIAID